MLQSKFYAEVSLCNHILLAVRYIMPTDGRKLTLSLPQSAQVIEGRMRTLYSNLGSEPTDIPTRHPYLFKTRPKEVIHSSATLDLLCMLLISPTLHGYLFSHPRNNPMWLLSFSVGLGLVEDGDDMFVISKNELNRLFQIPSLVGSRQLNLPTCRVTIPTAPTSVSSSLSILSTEHTNAKDIFKYS